MTVRMKTGCYPRVSEIISPMVVQSLDKRGGRIPEVVFRRPPTSRKVPLVVLLHGGLRPQSTDSLINASRNAAAATTLLASGFAVAVPTFSSRAIDPQSRDALDDCTQVLNALRERPDIEESEVFVYGCSGGGSLALELAGETHLNAAVVEEPASVLFTGMFNTSTPRAGEEYYVSDCNYLMEDPLKYYTDALRERTTQKIERISCPLLIVRGDQHIINRINEQILVPAIREAAKSLVEKTYARQRHCFGFGLPPCFDDPAQWQVFFSDLLAFLEVHLSGELSPLEEHDLIWTEFNSAQRS